MTQALRRWIGRALPAAALAVVAGLALWLAAPQPADAQSSGSGWQQVSAGAYHTCAVSASGAISCWGSNGYGQTTVPAGTYRQVTAGAFHTCALSTTGAISCWGSSSYGQTTVPAGAYRQVTAGAFSTCAVSTAGARSCWGSVALGTTTSFHACSVSSGTVSCSGSNVYGQTNAPTTGAYRQVATGRLHTCAVSTTGTISCWGSNTYGQTNAPAPPAPAPPPPPPPPPTIGERHRDGYFPLSFGGATLGQLKASGAALTVELTPAASVTGPAAHGAFAFQPGTAGGGAAASGLGLGALAALRGEVATYSDYDGATHGGLAIPNLPVYVRYAQSASPALRQAVLKVTLAGAGGGPQSASRTISVVPPAAPAAGVAGMLRGDADQIADLAQLAELAIGLRLAPALSDGEAALTSACLSAPAAAPTGACPAQVALGAGSRLQISGPAAFAGTDGAKLLEGGLALNCERTPALLGGAGIACFIVHDHDGNATTPPRAPSVRIDGEAARDVSIDAQIAAPSGASFYAQLMNADAAKPLYHDATGSYYPLASKYAGRHSVTVNCALVGENEVVISDGSAGPGETRTIERVRTSRCTTAAGETKTIVERTRYAAAADG